MWAFVHNTNMQPGQEFCGPGAGNQFLVLLLYHTHTLLDFDRLAPCLFARGGNSTSLHRSDPRLGGHLGGFCLQVGTRVGSCSFCCVPLVFPSGQLQQQRLHIACLLRERTRFWVSKKTRVEENVNVQTIARRIAYIVTASHVGGIRAKNARVSWFRLRCLFRGRPPRKQHLFTSTTPSARPRLRKSAGIELGTDMVKSPSETSPHGIIFLIASHPSVPFSRKRSFQSFGPNSRLANCFSFPFFGPNSRLANLPPK